jgi:hypothetical protein
LFHIVNKLRITILLSISSLFYLGSSIITLFILVINNISHIF